MLVGLAGSSGFVGGAVLRELRALRHEVRPVQVPRLTTELASASELIELARHHLQLHPELGGELANCDVLINAAGNPDASSRSRSALLGANALTVALLGVLAQQQPIRRMVHVSSAVVQGDVPTLNDEPAAAPFSTYSESKFAGEKVVEQLAADASAETQFVIYRPPSVHAADRRVSRLVHKLARSPLAVVAGRGDHTTPSALLGNVASAIAFLATCTDEPPLRVQHPSEGLSTAELMRILGGKEPLHLPTSLARAMVRTLKWSGRRAPALAANARRVEVLLLGQAQARSWLDTARWQRPIGREGWLALASELDQAVPDSLSLGTNA